MSDNDEKYGKPGVKLAEDESLLIYTRCQKNEDIYYIWYIQHKILSFIYKVCNNHVKCML